MKILRAVICVILGFCTVFTLFFGKKYINGKSGYGESVDYKGIINVWQIDSFEGGTGSRKQFLSDVAKTFEKKNVGVLVMVSSHTVESAEENFKKGIFPDILSYGYGVGTNGASELKTEKDFPGGKAGNKTFAIPWCRGGYVLIENQTAKGETAVISEGAFTLPEACAAFNDLSFSECLYEEPLTAYITFVSGNAKYLLGTQRDLVRLDNRGFDCKKTPLKGFNDLYQYVSVFDNDDMKSYFSRKYIDLLLSDEMQKKLYKICMFSPYTEVEYDGVFAEMQGLNSFTVPSVFTEKTFAEELKSYGKKYLSGEKGQKEKIEKMLL